MKLGELGKRELGSWISTTKSIFVKTQPNTEKIRFLAVKNQFQ